jgi:hypothetical protein
MSTFFCKYFSTALEYFRENGGAMHHYYEKTGLWWEVMPYDELAELLENDKTVRHATVMALRAGGMNNNEIDRELEDWIEVPTHVLRDQTP